MIKTAISTYSFGHYLKEWGIYKTIDKIAELGAEGVEFVDSDWSQGASLDELRKIGEYASEKGLAKPSFCVSANFLEGSDGVVSDEIARVKGLVDRAAALGVTNMRHDIANQPKSRKYAISYDYFLPQLADACREVTKYAEQKGVGTMTENHGRFSQDALRVEKLINTVAHPNFGMLIDLGNFGGVDEDPWKSVGLLLPYAKHVHAKDCFWKSGMEIDPGFGWSRTRGGSLRRATIIGHGDCHIFQSIQMLKQSGYDEYVAVEFEGIEDHILGITVGLENLKRFIAYEK